MQYFGSSSAQRSRIGYIKPVGQHSVPVEHAFNDPVMSPSAKLRFDEETKSMKRFVNVDKDVPLFKQVLGCSGSYPAMSPILFHKDYTKDFLNGKIPFREQEKRIRDGFESVHRESTFVVIEGTGHSGVGSLCGINNARVAAMLNAPMILIVNGGIGSAFDDLELNRYLCEAQGASIACVIMNKVTPAKMEEASHYLSKALQRWLVPLVGVIPDISFLDSPAVMDFERKLGMKLIGGSTEKHGLRHFSKTELVSTDATKFIESSKDFKDDTLFVMDASRTDLILAFLTLAQTRMQETGNAFAGGLVLAGKIEDIVPGIRSRFVETADVPILFAKGRVLDVIRQMQGYAHKLSAQDPERTLAVADHYKRHINFPDLLDAINPSF